MLCVCPKGRHLRLERIVPCSLPMTFFSIAIKNVSACLLHHKIGTLLKVKYHITVTKSKYYMIVWNVIILHMKPPISPVEWINLEGGV